MAAIYEYWTAVFRVGLEGFSDYDHDEMNAIASEGWEPVNMTAVHNGFATLVLFRRDVAGASRRAASSASGPAGAPAAAKKASPAVKKKASAVRKAR